MKYLSVVVITAALIFTACSSGKNAIASRKDFKGSWEITSARVDGAEGNLNITAFDDAALKCFEGSQWYLPNNGYGTYTINAGGDCVSGARQILWSQRVNGGITLFNFKKMDGVRKKNSKDIDEGYSLEVTSFEGDHFTARSPVQFEGKTIYIVYDFSRR
ncbi:MAG: lipocalin family protein [Niabella sp.]